MYCTLDGDDKGKKSVSAYLAALPEAPKPNLTWSSLCTTNNFLPLFCVTQSTAWEKKLMAKCVTSRKRFAAGGERESLTELTYTPTA